MRREVHQWLQQAEEDFISAREALDSERYYVTAFFSQQAAEKALKALFIDRLRQMPPATHDLLDLAVKVGAPRELDSPLRRLVPEFVKARYPDASGAVPADLYDEPIAKELLGFAEEVLRWTRPQIKR